MRAPFRDLNIEPSAREIEPVTAVERSRLRRRQVLRRPRRMKMKPPPAGADEFALRRVDIGSWPATRYRHRLRMLTRLPKLMRDRPSESSSAAGRRVDPLGCSRFRSVEAKIRLTRSGWKLIYNGKGGRAPVDARPANCCRPIDRAGLASRSPTWRRRQPLRRILDTAE